MSKALENAGLVIVDKPAGMTSHAVVARLRRIFGTRKVGHAGTLDPMATGVLVAGIERGTKLLAHLVSNEKIYEATLVLGSATSTDDIEGEVISTAPGDRLAQLNDATITQAIKENFLGPIQQRPARVSAIKVNGKRAHERARAGEQFELPAREVTIFSYEVGRIEHQSARILIEARIHCSSGTYIRSLARDLGELLEVGGHLSSLRRIQSGLFPIEMAQSLEALEEKPQLSLDLDQALRHCFPTEAVSAAQAHALSLGQRLPARGLQGVCAATDPDGHVIALIQENKNRISTVFVARPATLQ